MRKHVVGKILTIAVAASLSAMVLVGCGSEEVQEVSENGAVEEASMLESIADEPVALAADAEADKEKEVYFQKGVYANYSKDAENPPKNYFYVFNDESWGHTEEGANGAGVPFSCEQEDGQVKFSFGNADAIEDVFIVTSVEDGFVYGYYDDDMKLELVFEYLPDVDPDTFDAVNYASDGEYVYNDANGWSIKYDPKLFDITQDGNKVAIVYTGECAGTNMVMVTYDCDHIGAEIRNEYAKEYGDNAVTSDGIFPGTENVPGYWAMCPPAEEGSGLYMTSISRDYMDGSLTFELIGHNCGDEALDMEVADQMAMIIDSLTFSK